MDAFTPYHPALAALLAFVAIVVALAPISAMRKIRDGLTPGATPPEDYASRTYRLHRAHANATETLPIFATVTFAAILAGAAAAWVNLFSWTGVFARAVMVYFHVTGIGAANGGPRAFAFALNQASVVLILFLALFAVL